MDGIGRRLHHLPVSLGPVSQGNAGGPDSAASRWVARIKLFDAPPEAACIVTLLPCYVEASEADSEICPSKARSPQTVNAALAHFQRGDVMICPKLRRTRRTTRSSTTLRCV